MNIGKTKATGLGELEERRANLKRSIAQHEGIIAGLKVALEGVEGIVVLARTDAGLDEDLAVDYVIDAAAGTAVAKQAPPQ